MFTKHWMTLLGNTKKMKRIDKIYKFLHDEMLPALKERAKANDWPGVHERSFKTYICDDSCVGIELSFIDRTNYFEQKFYIEYFDEPNYEDYGEDYNGIVCYHDKCTYCSLKDKSFLCSYSKTRIDFRYDLLNIAEEKSSHETIKKAISEYVNSLTNFLEESCKFGEYRIEPFPLSYGSYECQSPWLNISAKGVLLDLLDYILIQYPFKLPIELVRLYEKRKEIHDYNISKWRLLENKDFENDLQRDFRWHFLKEFVKEEFFSDKKEKLLSREQRNELLEKMKKSNPHFEDITKELNLKVDFIKK